jgi:hypothetical protein
MFPWVYGFSWTPGHVIFVGVFLTVAAAAAVTVGLAVFRSVQDFRRGKARQIAWQSHFHDLPASDRACRHALTGELKGRVCDNGFDCRQCSVHARLTAIEPAPPAGRLYHRGHTWVRPAGDGTLLVGLDEIATKLLGSVDQAAVPPAGTVLEANAPAFTVRKKGAEFRILSPVDGVIVESHDGSQGWFARVKPAENYSDVHLLRGHEATAWFQREVDRLQMAACRVSGMPALADGGVLEEDLSEVLPPGVWESLSAEILLDS